MYSKHTACGTVVHVFEFSPQEYDWRIEIGKSGQLETLQQIAPNADYVTNWSVFDWGNGKNGYGRIQNGKEIIQPTSPDFPTVSLVNGKLIEGEFPDATPGFSRWRTLVRNGYVVVDFVADGNHRVKDARSAVGQLANGNIVLITVEGDDTQKIGMTGVELGQFAISLGCTFCCDCDGGGSAACRTKDGYIYNQGRAIAGAMVVRKKVVKEETKTMSKKLIALDDGHGMETAGKRTPAITELGGKVIHENEFNRAVVKFLDEDLKRCGFDTLLVAPGDSDVSLSTRTTLANTKCADLYVSIHYNALDGVFNGNDPEGHSVHIYPGSKEGRKLAECVLKYLVQGTAQKNRGIVESNFHVLRETKMPAILSENGFMDNKREAILMISEAFQREVAQEHAKGICEYFGVKWVEPVTAPTTNAKVLFSDMMSGGKPHYANDYVNSLVEKNIVEGYSDGTFHPAEYISRADVCVIVAKALESIEKKLK